MKRIIPLLLAFTLTAIPLAGCREETPAPSEPARVVLSVVTSYGGDDGNRSSFEAAIRDYEQTTGNLVKDGSATSNEEWKAKVRADFETASEPDVLFFFTNADAESFVSANKVVSIEEIRREYPGYAYNMKDSMLPAAADGKCYAVPSSGFWEALFVNKRVLEACGVSLPGPDYTWDQFLSDCETIKEAGYTPIGCSLAESPHYWFEFCVLNNGTVANHMEVPTLDGDGRLADDAVTQKWIAGLEDMKALYELGYFPENTLTASDAETVALVEEGKAAFLLDGSWKVGHFVETCPNNLEDFTVCCIPGKADRAATETIGGISMGYYITRKAWNDPAKREAAVELVMHLTSDAVMATFVTTEVTALKEPVSPAGMNALQREAAKNNGNVTAIVGAVQDTIPPEMKTTLFDQIARVVTGEISAAEAIEVALLAAQ